MLTKIGFYANADCKHQERVLNNIFPALPPQLRQPARAPRRCNVFADRS